MIIQVKNILSVHSKDLIYSELKKAGVEFVLSRTEEEDKLEVVFPSVAESKLFSISTRTFDQKKEKQKTLIQNVKAEILSLIYFSTEPLIINLSVYLSEKFSYDYTYLANLFSGVEGLTIEKFVILNKIERVKELMQHSDLTVTDIAILMHYSSISHLSAQFKKVTGITTRQYKKKNDQSV